MSRIFLTGGAGFVGFHTALRLAADGHSVTLYDAFLNYIDPAVSRYYENLRLRFERIQSNDIELIRGDVRALSALRGALARANPDVVLHLAAIPLATAANRFSEEAIQINLNGTVTLLEAVRETPSVRRVVLASSSFVYGDFQYEPADESHDAEPVDVYGATKLAGEALVKGFGRRYGIEWVVIRLSAVYGPTDANRRVTQIFVEHALLGQPMSLDGGGGSRVDFTYCEDAATGLAAACLHDRAANEVFNITRGEGRSIRELAEIVRELVPRAVVEYSEPTEPRPERGALAIQKAFDLIGYEPRYSLQEGMELYISFVRENGALQAPLEHALVP